MIAAYLNGEGKVLVQQDYPIPEVEEGEAIVRVTMAGVCNTDIELTRGYKGFCGVLGHEFVGVVHQLPEGPNRGAGDWEVQKGDRVVCEINCIAHCESAKCPTYKDKSQHPRRSALGIFGKDGGFAQYIRVPVCNMHSVPLNMPDETAVFCEPLAAACQILQQVTVEASHRVAVLGTGKLGLLIAQVLQTTGCTLTAFARREASLTIMTGLGIHAEIARPVSEMGDIVKFDVVVDCTGSSDGFNTALHMTRPFGTLVLKSTIAGMTEANLTKVVVDEISIVGSRCGPFEHALRLLSSGQVQVSQLVSARFPLSQADAAIEKAGEPGCLKVLLKA